jgi:hypothetical protein
MSDTTDIRPATRDRATSAPRATGERSRWERTAALGGLAFVVLSVVANFIPGAPPASDAPAAKVARYFKDNAGGIKLQLFLSGIAIAALLWWFGSLWRAMARAEDERPLLSVVAAVGFAIGIALALVSGVATSTAAIRIDSIGAGAELLWTLSLVAVSTAGFALAVFLAAVCALNHRTQMTPAWTTYVGGLASLSFLVSGIGSATDSNVFSVVGLVALLVWCVWILSVSCYLWRHPADENEF